MVSWDHSKPCPICAVPWAALPLPGHRAADCWAPISVPWPWDGDRALQYGKALLVLPSFQPHLHHTPLLSPPAFFLPEQFQLSGPLPAQSPGMTVLWRKLPSPWFASLISALESPPQGHPFWLGQPPLQAPAVLQSSHSICPSCSSTSAECSRSTWSPSLQTPWRQETHLFSLNIVFLGTGQVPSSWQVLNNSLGRWMCLGWTCPTAEWTPGAWGS